MPVAVSPKHIARRLTEHWSPRVVGEVDDNYVKGVRHNPVAEQEVHVLLFERKSTLHSGNGVNSRTRSIEEQLRPV